VTRGLVVALVLALAGPAAAKPGKKGPAPKAATARKPAASGNRVDGNHAGAKERASTASTATSESSGSSDASSGDDDSASPAPPTPATTPSGGKVKSKAYSFGAMDVEGKLKTPQLLYFLNRVKLELDMSAPDKRSFMKELQQSADDKNL
jgi:hypothetical protein